MKLLQLSVLSMVICLLLAASGIKLGYQSAEAYYPTVQTEAFTPTGMATLTVSQVSSSVPLASTGASSPAATIAVIQNLGAKTAYVALGAASNVTATVSGGFPIMASQKASLTVRDSKYLAAIAATGESTVLSVATGY